MIPLLVIIALGVLAILAVALRLAIDLRAIRAGLLPDIHAALLRHPWSYPSRQFTTCQHARYQPQWRHFIFIHAMSRAGNNAAWEWRDGGWRLVSHNLPSGVDPGPPPAQTGHLRRRGRHDAAPGPGMTNLTLRDRDSSRSRAGPGQGRFDGLTPIQTGPPDRRHMPLATRAGRECPRRVRARGVIDRGRVRGARRRLGRHAAPPAAGRSRRPDGSSTRSSRASSTAPPRACSTPGARPGAGSTPRSGQGVRGGRAGFAPPRASPPDAGTGRTPLLLAREPRGDGRHPRGRAGLLL